MVKKRYFLWLLNYTADGEFRICVPMSDVIDGQFDEGVKMLLDIGSERAKGPCSLQLK